MLRSPPVLWVLVACTPDPGAGPPRAAAGPSPSTGAPTESTEPADSGTPPTTAIRRWVGLSSGFAANCGINPDRSVECWGNEVYLGTENIKPGPFTRVVVGDVYACGLLTDGSVECWGCETGADTWTNVCQPLPGPYVDLVAGTYAACGQTSYGEWECWGIADNGKPFPQGPAEELDQVDVGISLACGLAFPGASPTCWGATADPDRGHPPDGLYLIDLASGFLHGCGLDEAGHPLCWGLQNDLTPYPDPPFDEPFVEIDAREALTCALRADGTAACWGADGLVEDVDVTPPDATFAEISVGNTHACGLTVDGEILCWGHDRGAGETVVPQ